MKCLKCKKPQRYSHFRLDKRNGKRRTTCRDCENLLRRKKRATVFSPQQTYAYEYLLRHKCVSCGMTNPVCLDFHHLDPKTKSFGISDMIKNCKPITLIQSEIDKCVVLCANCHRIETGFQTKNYKYRLHYEY